MSSAKFADSAKSELFQTNWMTGNTRLHPRSRSERSSTAESSPIPILFQIKNDLFFALVPLATCGAFPVSMVKLSKGVLEAEIQK